MKYLTKLKFTNQKIFHRQFLRNQSTKKKQMMPALITLSLPIKYANDTIHICQGLNLFAACLFANVVLYKIEVETGYFTYI